MQDSNPHTLPAKRIAAYRKAARPQPLDMQMDALNALSELCNALLDAGREGERLAVERLWLITATQLAGTPAGDVAEALRKTTHLEHALKQWILPHAIAHGYAAAAGLLGGAVEAERQRWALPGPDTLRT